MIVLNDLSSLLGTGLLMKREPLLHVQEREPLKREEAGGRTPSRPGAVGKGEDSDTETASHAAC